MMADRFERAAIDLAERGYYVFPLLPGKKTPLIARAAGGNGHNDATRDERKILHWWTARPDANVGLACGASGVAVLDIDAKAGADPEDVLGELDLDGAPVIKTGEAPDKPGSLAGVRGAQVYFRGDLPGTNRLKIAGTEIRGRQHYVVAPPSVHPSGVTYEGTLPAVADLPPVPAWLLALIEQPPGGPAGRKPAAEWLSMLRDGVPDHRHDRLAAITGHFLRRYIDVDLAAELVHLINEQRCRPPLPHEEVDRVFESICAAEQRRRGSSS